MMERPYLNEIHGEIGHGIDGPVLVSLYSRLLFGVGKHFEPEQGQQGVCGDEQVSGQVSENSKDGVLQKREEREARETKRQKRQRKSDRKEDREIERRKRERGQRDAERDNVIEQIEKRQEK